ncbi:hypothetical protein [Actinopolyspora halophila]|uniref:hypothetical protein n=1 Tax=Actinopolyspora halophila TaxID=1850 RepID=UPI000369D37D|nr:hypothetical protein [Actinopolyspora halophila]
MTTMDTAQADALRYQDERDQLRSERDQLQADIYRLTLERNEAREQRDTAREARNVAHRRGAGYRDELLETRAERDTATGHLRGHHERLCHALGLDPDTATTEDALRAAQDIRIDRDAQAAARDELQRQLTR